MACTPATTKGGCVPVIVFDDEGSCAGPAGTPVLGSPTFVPVVDNAPDLTWRDEDHTPVQADDDSTVFLFDNT